MLRELYAYREMIFSLVRRYLKGRYKGSFLGFFWTFLNPLLQLAVYTMVFSVILRNGREDYYLFLFVALVPWIFFSSCASSGVSCIWQQQDMVKKIYFPREVLPLSFVISNFVNMVLSLLVVLVVLVVSGKGLSFQALLYLPVIMAVEFLLCLGITLILSGLDIYFRDLEYLMGIITMAWQFLTPIMYGIDQVPEEYRPIFYLNPMTPVIGAYRDILYFKKPPELQTLGSAVAAGVLLCALGFFVFGRLKRRFAEAM